MKVVRCKLWALTDCRFKLYLLDSAAYASFQADKPSNMHEPMGGWEVDKSSHIRQPMGFSSAFILLCSQTQTEAGLMHKGMSILPRSLLRPFHLFHF